MIPTAEKLIILLDVAPDERRAMAQKFSMLSPIAFDPDKLERLTAEGFYEFKAISWDGIAQYGVWFNPGIDGGLHVRAAVQLCPEPIFDTLAAGLALIARHKGCSFIQFHTARPGLVRKAAAIGYVAQSVLMVKQL